MTRELLLLFMGGTTLGGAVAVCMKLYLLYTAFRARRRTLDRSPNTPERLVADDMLLDNSGRLVLALSVTGLGVIFVYGVLNSPPPLTGTYDLSTAGIALLALLGVLALVEMLQGVRGMVNLQRINRALALLSKPPEVCELTTFAECPFATPERLLKIRGMTRELAADVEEITENLP